MPQKEPLQLVRSVPQQAQDDLRDVLRSWNDTVELRFRRGDGDASSNGRVAERVELFDGVVVGYLHEGPHEASVFSIGMDVAETLARRLDSCRDVIGPQRPRKRVQTEGQR